MPLYIRKLPCSSGVMVEQKNIPQNTSLYNPSKSGKYTYIRETKRGHGGETNGMLIHNETTGKITHIDTPYHLMPKTVNFFKGIEDLRLCTYNDRLWFGGTSTHISDNMNNELVVGYFNKEITAVEKLQMVDIGSRPVKNVIPFVYENKMYLLDTFLSKIYELKEKEDTKEWYIEIFKELVPASGISNEKYRGSTSPIHLHGSIYGCVVHDIIFNDNKKLMNRLAYMHHWMEFDIDLGIITFISTPFWICHWGVEYVSGIDVDTNGKITLFIGINDKLPIKAVTTLSDLRVGK